MRSLALAGLMALLVVACSSKEPEGRAGEDRGERLATPEAEFADAYGVATGAFGEALERVVGEAAEEVFADPVGAVAVYAELAEVTADARRALDAIDVPDTHGAAVDELAGLLIAKQAALADAVAAAEERDTRKLGDALKGYEEELAAWRRAHTALAAALEEHLEETP